MFARRFPAPILELKELVEETELLPGEAAQQRFADMRVFAPLSGNLQERLLIPGVWFMAQYIVLLRYLQNQGYASGVLSLSPLLLPSPLSRLRSSRCQGGKWKCRIMRPGVYIALICNILNAVFNYVFIFSLDMDIDGAPIATSMSRYLAPTPTLPLIEIPVVT